MIKRSQNKKKWSIVNYKNRWFEISRSFLIYYDNCEGGREVSLLFPLFMISFILIPRKLERRKFFGDDECSSVCRSSTCQPFAGLLSPMIQFFAFFNLLLPLNDCYNCIILLPFSGVSLSLFTFSFLFSIDTDFSCYSILPRWLLLLALLATSLPRCRIFRCSQSDE